MKKSALKLAFGATLLGFIFNLQSMAQGKAVVDSVAMFTGITNTSAFTGGFVSSNGGNTLTERGVCYGISANPTIADGKVPAYKISTVNVFEPACLEELTPNTTYYVRAYATNSAGTSYSVQKSFKTTNNAESFWQLSGVTQFTAAITGDITAESIDNSHFGTPFSWDQNSGKLLQYGSDYLKIPAGVTDANYSPNNYLLFTVSPKAGKNYTVKKVNLVAFGYKSGVLKLTFEYSLDNFATASSLGMANCADSVRSKYNATSTEPILVISGSPNDGDYTQKLGGQYISFSPNIVVPSGKKLSIRMYGWGKAAGTYLFKDIIVSGETSGVVSVIRKQPASELAVYPNPVTDRLYVKNDSEINRYEVYSVTGEVLKTVINKADLLSIDVSGLSQGCYILKTYSARGSKQIKFMKQ